MSDQTCIKPEIVPVLAQERPALSGRLAVLRSGEHLLRIMENLREVEVLMLRADRQDQAAVAALTETNRSRLQSLDLMIQELTGLSDILIGIASRLSDDPDPHIDVLVDLPRLQTLTHALRNGQQMMIQHQIVLF